MKTGQKGWILVLVAVAVAAVLWMKQHPQQNPISASDSLTLPFASENAALPRLVDLGADKCTSCKLMAPILTDLGITYTNRLHVTFIDVWVDEKAADPYHIQMIPTQIFFDAQGNELYRHEGFFGKEDILSKWNELGYDFQ
jgi:thioredoxin